jgi:rfaE bifunctional protein kinase chain/domain
MFEKLLRSFADCRVMVLGDVILDEYIWGSVERVSAEAPIPVLEVRNEECRLGGAANVALNIRSMGGEVCFAGVLGADEEGEKVRSLLGWNGIASIGLIPDPGRRTTLKTRIGSGNQQIVRLDREQRHEISVKVRDRIIDYLKEKLPTCTALIIEDYNKGLLTPELIREAITISTACKVPVAVDPKQRNFFEYKGIDIFKPNFTELKLNLSLDLEDHLEFQIACQRLRERQNIKHMVVTRGAKGMYVFDTSGDVIHFPTAAKEVFDVSGAGDTVISALTLAYACGGTIREAAEIANHAAGVVCGKRGTACATPSEILDSFNDKR